MSNDKKTGGPAFPTSSDQFGSTDASIHGGMTLRDHFAGLAMAAIIQPAEREWYKDCVSNDEAFVVRNTIAFQAYSIADAMLKAREQ
jgi:hypothetical protein